MITFILNHKITKTGFLVLVVLASSCKKLIEIPANPPTAITEAQQFADSATAMTAISGIYSYTGFASSGFMYNNAYFTACTSLSSNDLVYTATYDPNMQQFYTNGVNDLNTLANTLWGNPYTGLYGVNAVLSNIAASNVFSAPFKTQITGEMKLVRAFYYFNTVNLFGDIPLVLSTDYKKTSVLPRTPVEGIYTQILSDLADAQKALPAAYPSDGRVRPNLYTVLSLLSKVQLYRKQWQAAYDAANSVIGSGLYTLEPDPNKVFLDGSNEAIWQIPATGSNNVTQEASSFIPYSSSIPTYLLSPELLNAFETGDLRRDAWVQDYLVNVNGTDEHFYGPYKYKNLNATTTPYTEDYMIFRVADLYLIRAEAAAHLGKTTEALDDLNLVRARAGLGASSAVTADEIIAAVLGERRIEFFCEWGNRWFDLKRTGTIDAVLSAEKPGWKPYLALYPVPRPQRQFNSLLTQNPGY